MIAYATMLYYLIRLAGPLISCTRMVKLSVFYLIATLTKYESASSMQYVSSCLLSELSVDRWWIWLLWWRWRRKLR